MNCSSTHLTSDPTRVMLLTWQQPDSTATALNKFCSICTPNGVYTEFGIDPIKEIAETLCPIMFCLLQEHPVIHALEPARHWQGRHYNAGRRHGHIPLLRWLRIPNMSKESHRPRPISHVPHIL